MIKKELTETDVIMILLMIIVNKKKIKRFLYREAGVAKILSFLPYYYF